MQKLKLSVIGFCCLLAVSKLCAQWQHADVSATALYESMPDIAVEVDGTAHIVFQKETASGGRDIFYANTVGNILSIPQQITNFAADVWYPAIALDAGGNVHVAFENRTNKTAVYLNNIGGLFSPPVEFGDPGSTGADFPRRVSLDVDANGFAHIVYYDEVAGVNHIFYANNTGGSFVVSDLGSFGFNSAGFTLGAWRPHVDERNGVVHIAFVGNSSIEVRAIYYVNNSGGSFGSAILVTDGDDLGDDPTISVEQDGTVHIVSDIAIISGIYHSVSNSSGEFDTEPVIGPGYWGTDHALGPSNEIGIAVTPNDLDNNVPQDGIVLLSNEGGSWSSDVIIPPSAVEDVSEYGAKIGHGIAIDGDGYVHVVGRQVIYTRSGKGKGKKKIIAVNHNVRYHTNNPNFSPGGPAGGTMHVENIKMSTEPANGNRWKAVADVLIHDDQGQPVDGARVSGSWSGLVSGSSTATTGPNGVATLKSPKTKKIGEIVFEVTIVTKDGVTYDPSANEETSGSITGPPTGKVSAGESETGLPTEFALFGNYPNPFNPETRIRFALPEASHAEITIYNTRGQVIRQLVSQNYPAGEHAIKWDGLDQSGKAVSSGVYLYRLQAGDFSRVRKMSLLQ
ncbi:MAG: T9SS type A sorting domain-containing protein [Nitrospirae bacterium]|nr:T9SS type A sorting domain-containing protein [Nitrospirota bacterium]